jgi:hypothetical protein
LAASLGIVQEATSLIQPKLWSLQLRSFYQLQLRPLLTSFPSLLFSLL